MRVGVHTHWLSFGGWHDENGLRVRRWSESVTIVILLRRRERRRLIKGI